jgi:ribonuclease H2 subunit B
MLSFAPLEAHLLVLQQEELAAAAARATLAPKAKGGKGTKGGVNEEAGKKRKGGIAKASTGVEKLKKANVNGMSKLSSFFVKK